MSYLSAIREAIRRETKRRTRAKLESKWKSCCRCFPGMVSDKGLCGCCGMDQATGKTDPAHESWSDPDYFDMADDEPPNQEQGE